MNFASYDFWKLLILCFLGSRIILAVTRRISPQAENSTAKLCLLGTALTLLASESWLTLAAFLWVVLLGWLCVLLQGSRLHYRPKSTLFLILLVAQIAPLFYYKYWNFVLNECLGFDVRVPSVLIPMGLSFYTFQTIGFWIDNLRAPQPRPSFLDYLNFSSFFPQIVAGPIEKRESLLPQIQQTAFRIHRANLESALQWIILGLAYKLIVADNIAVLSDKFRVDAANAWHVWFECFAFGIRIYFDFAGYSFIAVGLGLLFGIHLTLNFRCPYWSLNLREFWRNWHVTLGSWLRDYIYLPLGGKRVRLWALNTLIVFLVSGVWHGAGWGFILWGALHGLGVAAASIKRPWTIPSPVAWFITFTYTIAVWLFFLERDPHALLIKAITLVKPTAYSLAHLLQMPLLFNNASESVTTAFVILLACGALLVEALSIRSKKEPYQLMRHPAASLLLVFLIIQLAPTQESSFIYFNF